MNQPTFALTVEDEKENYSKIIFEPLERGYGQTIGNALRRVLLSSLPGSAITQVKIEGVSHQFSTLAGMSEDIVEFVLNTKQIRVFSETNEPTTLTLETKGEGQVTAGDITTPAGVRIVNPDLVLATLAPKAKLSVEFKTEYGMGYQMADERKSDTIGVIPVDALFSPIEKVSFKVESTRVGRRTDFDKLIMEVWTNGTVDGKTAVEEAAKILVAQFTQVFNPVVASDDTVIPVVAGYSKQDETLKLTVEELDLPTRIANALRKGGYKTVGDLVSNKKAEIAKVKNLGGKSIELVEEALSKKGLALS
ncbi:MAG TPA: DNA-directed RNA polymerase subunit alpha [Patescibacteria group bacterium]|nr:DNA-directed RNA polymerase subunit alpha [Patescibacteria group bacterium]